MSEELGRKVYSGLFWKFSERIIAQTISLVVSIIIARILVPENYSVVSIVAIFFTFANVFISGGLNTALIQKKDSDSLDYSTILYVSLFVSIALYILLFFTAPLISSLYDLDILIPVIRVMGLTLPITAVKSIWCAYISSTFQFKKFFFATIGGTIISGAVGIWMALNGYGPWALIAQQMINTSIDTIILVATTRIHLSFKFSFNRLKTLFKYGWKIFVASIISCIYDETNPLIVGIKFSKNDLAFYDKGRSFPNYVSNSLSDSLASVMFPAISKIQDNLVRVKSFTKKFMKVGSFVVFPMMIGFLAISDNFVNVVLTAKWAGASIYIKVFCVALMLEIMNRGNLQAIRAIGRSDVILKLEIIKKTSYFITIILFVLFAPNPIILSLSAIVNAFIALIANSIPNKRLIGYSIFEQLSDIALSLLCSLLMGAAVYFLGYIPLNNIALLIIQIASGILLYFVASILLNKGSLNELLGVAKSFKRKKR